MVNAWGKRLQRENEWGRVNGRQARDLDLAHQMGKTVEELKLCRGLLEGCQEKEE